MTPAARFWFTKKVPRSSSLRSGPLGRCENAPATGAVPHQFRSVRVPERCAENLGGPSFNSDFRSLKNGTRQPVFDNLARISGPPLAHALRGFLQRCERDVDPKDSDTGASVSQTLAATAPKYAGADELPRVPISSAGSSFDAAFLGPLAENAELMERLIVDALRDHVYWRRNFHPEDPPVIATGAKYDESYQKFVARTEHVLRRLAADLKGSAPWFSPRYIGHMASDLLIPGVVARILATLYNPNNVSADSGGPMLAVETEVGYQLARMVGFDTEVGAAPRAWGHLTSGGTVANYEGLRQIRAVRLLPVALGAAARSLGLGDLRTEALGGTVDSASVWQLLNLGVGASLEFRKELMLGAFHRGGASLADALHRETERGRVEQVGLADFAREHGIKSPVVLAPHSAHYSWAKALRLLGLGTNNLIAVDTDAHMRMDVGHLRTLLDELAVAKRPVLAVVGVLGTTEFGTLDPIHEIAAIRDVREKAGQAFAVHVDAAWGGYLTTLIREQDGAVATRATVGSEFRYFPSQHVYDALVGISKVDSVTIDPHKLGFIPYPAGAFVTRDRRVAGLLSATAAYVFDNGSEAPTEVEVNDADLGRYVLEGSKPGSSAASVFATHEVLPLDRDGFGQLLSRTIHSSEWLFDELRQLSERLAGTVRLQVPIEPDCNVVCLIVNPEGNRDAKVMNAFMRDLVEGMRLRPGRPASQLEFMGSFTSIDAGRMLSEDGRRVLKSLGVDSATVAAAGSVFVLRHTLMNPWLLNKESRPLARYMGFLERRIEELLESR